MGPSIILRWVLAGTDMGEMQDTDREQREGPEASRGSLRLGWMTAAAAAFGTTQAAAQGPLPPQTAAARSRRDDLYYLVNRGTFGHTPETYAEARSRGYDGWLDWQLNPNLIPDPEVDLILAGLPTLWLSYSDLWNLYGPNGTIGDTADASSQLAQARMFRAVKSTRQLFERVVEFWADHINVPHGNAYLRLFRTVYDRDVIREHALGYFPDMLMASAKSASMLLYLNGDENVVGAPNENYAREVMELHTLGVDGGYNEQDIQELARCFTGWSYVRLPHPQYGEFLFEPTLHDYGSKSVMGQNIPAGGGLSDGEFMLNYLALHPATAEYVCRELATFLLDYDPPQQLVDEAKAVFLSTGGHMKEVVRTVMDKKWIGQVDPWGVRKLRRPMHYVCNVLRTPGLSVVDVDEVLESLGGLGQVPFSWQAPDGFPDNLDTWGSSLLPRWDFAFRVFRGAMPGVQAPGGALFSALGSPSTSELVSSAAMVLAAGNIDREELGDIEGFVQSGVLGNSGELMRNVLSLMASLPSYQYL